MKLGSLCTGYGGLDIATHSVLGGEMVWYSEFDKHPSTLLEQRYPGIPNHGDLTKIDWGAVEPVDVLTGGYPCQPFSAAGLRLGEKDERHLWPHIHRAIRILQPSITILENVAGHRSSGFANVLRDCAEDGLTVRWVSVRASDAGAPHRRERLFFTIANPSSPGPQGQKFRPRGFEQAAECNAETSSHPQSYGLPGFGDTRGRGEGPEDMHGFSWGVYEPAIRRWEHTVGPVPNPTEPNKNGRPRLTAVFVEWMMGLPKGWVTDSGIPYTAQIKLLGNGVVPQQAEIALRYLLDNE